MSPSFPRRALEEAQTEKPADHRRMLEELVEVSTEAGAAIAAAIPVLQAMRERMISERLRDAHARLFATCESVYSAIRPRVHVLKTWPGPFAQVRAGLKKYEVRRLDRDFRVGDELKLVEYDAGLNTYSGEALRARITTITKGEWGLPPDIGVLGIELVEEAP
jgi:hypothetical protein